MIFRQCFACFGATHNGTVPGHRFPLQIPLQNVEAIAKFQCVPIL